MNELEIIKIAANVGGYLVMCFYLISTGRKVADDLISAGRKIVEAFLERLIVAIAENTAARLKDAEEKGKLGEKIDALTKGAKP